MTDSTLAGGLAERIERLADYRGELTSFAYRSLGSTFEAEDAVQETMLRAWRALDRFEGRSDLRTWLYRICDNVCRDMRSSSQRRARPLGLGRGAEAGDPFWSDLGEESWAARTDAGVVPPPGGDPAELALARESVRLALITALQHLPRRQRAILILRDVLRWNAAETAGLLGTSVASVNSALQRARAALRRRRVARTPIRPFDQLDDEARPLFGRYVTAWERSDIQALTSLVAEEAR
ncbi:MAG TPA: RNA polymerase subunit sigma-70 [Candidatus Limnocylindria bacterium]|nr:RNA polymerase subunit sigma-70 [Candidatus Limnocylindria bacterium]